MINDPLIGQLIDDQYLIESQLGEGGMGCVYRAKNQKLGGRPCAIKVLLEEVGDSKLGKKRFEEEQKIIAQLRSPHIVQVLDKGELEDGRLFIVMELLEGEPLSALIKREGALSVKRAIPIIQGVLAGLSEAHQYGIIHRDLKPANIFITRSVIGYEIAKVLDFGIAKSMGPDATELTQSQAIMGTPRYMTPEQFLQDRLTTRTDLYATGLLFYEMLAGHPPFTKRSESIPNEVKSLPEVVQLMWLHLNLSPPQLNVAEPVWALVSSLLAKNQEERPSDATEVIQRLSEMKELLEQGALNLSSPPQAQHWATVNHNSEATTVDREPLSGPHSREHPLTYPSSPHISGIPHLLGETSGAYPTNTYRVSSPSWLRYGLGASAVAVVGVGLWFALSPSPPEPTTTTNVIKLDSTKLPAHGISLTSPHHPTQVTTEPTSSAALPQVSPSTVPQRPIVEPVVRVNTLSPLSPPITPITPAPSPPSTPRVVPDDRDVQVSPIPKAKAVKRAAKPRKRAVKPSKKRTPVAKSVSLKVLTRGMFFAPGSSLRLKTEVRPRELSSKLRYVVRPSGAATFKGDLMRLSGSVSTNLVRVKACVQSVCSLPVKIRVGLEDAPE